MRIIHQQVALVNPSEAKFADNLSFQTLSSLLHSRHLLVRRGGNERDSPHFAAFGACLLHVLDRHLIDFRLPLNNPPIQKSRGSQHIRQASRNLSARRSAGWLGNSVASAHKNGSSHIHRWFFNRKIHFYRLHSMSESEILHKFL